VLKNDKIHLIFGRRKKYSMVEKINKLRRFSYLFCLVLLVGTITGCAELSYNKDDEQLMVDYMVEAVLNHDIHYNAELEYVEVEIEETTTWNSEKDTTTSEKDTNNTTEDTTTDNGGQEETTSSSIIVETDMNGILNLPGFSVTYTDYMVTDTYPDENSFASMKAVEGSNLIVLKLNVKNTTNEEQTLNMLEKDMRFKGVFNSKVKTNCQITLLPDAFNSYIGTFIPGEEKELVLIYIVSEKSLQNISTIKLEIKNADKTETIILKN
jgi:hypothetical protein